ncbi:MAG: HEAT repeat domain-containing protein [Sedimentisphaerales bacterium]|nr:HEAT repeat domain-containing protein [Sedimentisphaerales bacterium]
MVWFKSENLPVSIAMIARRLYVLILLFAMGCQQAEVGKDKQEQPADKVRTVTRAELSRQLKINRDALLHGANEQIRIEAATVMLYSDEPAAREVLLSALSPQGENVAARSAICKALSQARGIQETIKAENDFVSPLLEILATKDFSEAKLAAEAALLFDYEQIAGPLEKMAADKSLPVKVRLNVIYALKLQPDMRAIFQLIRMLDDPDKQVAAEAESVLHSLGLPVGKDVEARKQIIDELKRKGRNDFLRDWMVRQETQMRNFETEVSVWQGLYLSALDKIFEGIGEDTSKGKFLAEHLINPKEIVRLWALEKVAQWRVGTKSELPAEVGPVLVNLVSDQNRDVRLRAARLLSLMGQLDSSQTLLQQIEIEQDDEVKTELFAALGGACYYAFLPGSDVKVPEEVRQKTLEWATKFLLDENPKKSQKGAEVLKRLLEQNGLAPMDVERHLGLLAERYNQEDKSDGVLRGELLEAMAGLCGPRIPHKAAAAKIFEPLFEEALSDKADLVREASVEGLINIDKAKAFGKLKEGFANDSSAKIRQRVIGLAGEVGSSDDLPWLAERIGSSESEQAWQAMQTIFKAAGADVLSKWVEQLSSQEIWGKLSDEQKISFLETAERKANGEKRGEMLKSIREKLAQLYSKTGRYEQAARILGQLREAAGSPEEKDTILVQLFDVYLRWPKAEAAAQLVSNCLLEKDLGPDSVIVMSIEKYLAEMPATAEPNILLDALIKVKPADKRPMWAEQVRRWTKRFGPAAGDVDESKNGG